jgi:hypothetical protein
VKLFLKGPLSYVGWLEVYLHLFLTWALNGSELSELLRRRLTTGKEPSVTNWVRDWQGVGGGSRSGSERSGGGEYFTSLFAK